MPNAQPQIWFWTTFATIATMLGSCPAPPSGPADGSGDGAVAGGDRPNIFFYNLDDLRDAFPGGIDPMELMPKTQRWMADGRRYTDTFVADPSCCPSRASLMTGRYPHNNGVHNQQDGPKFDGDHSMACYLQGAGYQTFVVGKFLVTWPRDERPPCFDHSTVMWGGYEDVEVSVDGVPGTGEGYSTTYLGEQGRTLLDGALAKPDPFLLYEAPQAPHWVETKRPDGSVLRGAVPDEKYADAPTGRCAGEPEADRTDKPDYVRTMAYTQEQGQELCEGQLRAIMTADDEFDATMRLLQQRGELDDTLVIFSSDNGYMWGEHGRWEKFVPYEPALRVPLYVRWPGHVEPGRDTERYVSYLDLLPTMLQAAGWTPPRDAPPFDGESLLEPSTRTTMYSEYYNDPANANIPSWRLVRTRTAKYVQTYDADGTVIAREYYDLVDDPGEQTNLLGDRDRGNDPPAAEVADLTRQLDAFAGCGGADCVQ